MKELLLLIISMGLTLSQFAASMPDKSNPDWFCYGADSWHTCFVPPDAGPKTNRIERKWGLDNKSSGKPTVVGDKVYIGFEGGMKCLNARTGNQIWFTPTPGACCRQVLYYEGKCYCYS